MNPLENFQGWMFAALSHSQKKSVSVENWFDEKCHIGRCVMQTPGSSSHGIFHTRFGVEWDWLDSQEENHTQSKKINVRLNIKTSFLDGIPFQAETDEWQRLSSEVSEKIGSIFPETNYSDGGIRSSKAKIQVEAMCGKEGFTVKTLRLDAFQYIQLGEENEVKDLIQRLIQARKIWLEILGTTFEKTIHSYEALRKREFARHPTFVADAPN